jgi:hemoglobin
MKPLAIFIALLLIHSVVYSQKEVPEKAANENGMLKLSLYKRIGGYDAVAGFVDLAFPRVATHPELAHFFIGHADDSKYRQRQMIIDKLVNTMQGPVVYTGRSLESVHKGLNITSDQWNTFMKIITTAMDERGIKGEEKKDFVDIFDNVFRALTVEEELRK